MKRFFAISMSLIILFGSMGFTIATHYCCGHAVKSQLVLGNKNIDCGMKKETGACQHSSHKKGCFENKYLSFNIEDDYEVQAPCMEISPDFFLSFVISYYELGFLKKMENVTYKDYSPPPLLKDHSVLHQVFLI